MYKSFVLNVILLEGGAWGCFPFLYKHCVNILFCEK